MSYPREAVKSGRSRCSKSPSVVRDRKLFLMNNRYLEEERLLKTRKQKLKSPEAEHCLKSEDASGAGSASVFSLAALSAQSQSGRQTAPGRAERGPSSWPVLGLPPSRVGAQALCLSQAGRGGLKFAAAPACFKVAFFLNANS